MTRNIIKASLAAVLVVAVSSCKEDNYYLIDPTAIPLASDYNIKMDVNQETNQVTLNLVDLNGNNAKGVYPIWTIYKNANPTISTREGYTDIFTLAGDYDVEMKVGNRNGISEGAKTATIHIENTIVDFSPYIKNLTNNDSKVWQIAATEQGHLGCGPSGTEGLEWWSAAPYDKKDWGVYDNLMTFKDNGENGAGAYIYDPGASGTIYVNTGITSLPPYSDSNTNDGNDYCAPAQVQETTFTLTPEGNDLFLVFPEGTLLGYLPNVEAYYSPKFKVYSITRNKIELSIDNGDIAWHYIFYPEGTGDDNTPKFEGFKYDSEFNLWRTADLYVSGTYFADDNWSPIDTPDIELANERIFLHTPAGIGNSQWQAQLHVGTGIKIEEGKTYDFSMYLNAPVDCSITVKPHPDGNDDVFFVADKQNFEAGGSYYYFSDVPGFDTDNLVLTLDFGGYPDTDFEITKIVLKDHANDDGTVLPTDTPDVEPTVSWVDVNSDANLWNSATVTNITSWTSPSDWSGSTAEPDVTPEGNGYSLYYSEAPGSDQWQAQFGLETDLSFPGDKAYDFRVTIVPTCDINGATVKPTDFTDNSFWSADRHDLYANEDNVIQLVNVSADMPDFKIVFDFAGVQQGATVVIKDIIIQEHQDAPIEPAFSWVGVDSPDNIWNSATMKETTSWTSPSDWSGSTAEPQITPEGNGYSLYYSEAPGPDQWQAQFGINTDLSFPGDKAYDFRVTIVPTCDITGATVKPTNYGDNSFWSDGRHDIYAYEDNVIELKNVTADMPDFKIVFDFAGVQQGATVVVKDIIIQEHR